MEFVDLSAIILLSQKTLSAKIFLLRLLEKIIIIKPSTKTFVQKIAIKLKKKFSLLKEKKIATEKNFSIIFKI